MFESGVAAKESGQECAFEAAWKFSFDPENLKELSIMNDAIEAATAFVRAVADGDADVAHKMLSHSLAADVTAVDLSAQFGALADDMGGVTGIGQAMVILEDWPGKSEADRAMVYVPLEGDEFSEAVTITISASGDSLCISAIEWGRP